MKTVFRISSLLLLVLFAVLLTGTAAFADDSSDLPFMVGDQEVNITLRFGENQTLNPKDMYRIVRFSQEKKERIITWMEFDYSLIKSESIKDRSALDVNLWFPGIRFA